MTSRPGSDTSTSLARLPLTELGGVGATRAAHFARLGLRSVRDLLLYLPQRHETSGVWTTCREAGALVGETVRIRGTVTKVSSFRRGPRRSTLRFALVDDTGEVMVSVFNQPWRIPTVREWAVRSEVVAVEARVGEVDGKPVLTAPRFETASATFSDDVEVRAVYRTTDGLGAEWLARVIQGAVEAHADELPELLPEAFLLEHELPSLGEAVRAVHSGREVPGARRRVALEALLSLQARLFCRPTGGNAVEVSTDLDRLRASSPYEWTSGQAHAIEVITADLGRNVPMRRLLQGDVGSGKTLVATMVAEAVIANGGQVALMAPTSTLAEQHFAGLDARLGERGLRVDLLTGSLGAKRRREVLERIATGETQLVIGTHALVSRGVAFANLVLAIIDEEQRFGVAQRNRLVRGGQDVHALVMTATPIPRSLALTLYGEWDSVRLDGFPPGRGKRRTRVVDPRDLPRALDYAEERLAKGEQVFWIVPRIAGETDSIEAVAPELEASAVARFGLEVVHGRLPTEDRQARLARFSSGISRVLLGTTVVEVGVDVPPATVLVVQGAERFGLAQLHQLRGRVGRGPKSALAIFGAKASSRGRMKALETTEDGFAIAEEDLQQRGMGELLGLRQSGPSTRALEEVVDDLELVRAVRSLLGGRADLVTFYRAPGNFIFG